MKSDDRITFFFRDIRRLFYSAFNEWLVGDRKAMLFSLKKATILLQELISTVEDLREGK